MSTKAQNKIFCKNFVFPFKSKYINLLHLICTITKNHISQRSIATKK